jgi:polar amino acid transport system substrate-binding protein
LRRSSHLLILSLILFFTVSAGLKSQAETILERVNRQGSIQVGIREDAVPFSYRDINNDLSGICLDFINLLRQELEEKLNQEVLTVKIYKSTLYNRFNLVKDKVIDLECGPNTIRDDLDNITFSKPFFITGTQFLIRKEDENKFKIDGPLANFKLGVLRNTTTKQFIEQRYPRAILQEFQGVTGRRRGVEAVKKGTVDGFASDGILLIGEATLLGLAIPKDYTLVPSHPLDCEYYGLILPADDPEWRDFVNAVINPNELRSLLRKWFSVVAPYIQETINFCSQPE